MATTQTNSVSSAMSDALLTFQNYIEDQYNNAISIENKGNLIDLKKMHDREQYIIQLTSIMKSIETLHLDVQKKISTLGMKHEKDLATVTNLISGLTKVQSQFLPIKDLSIKELSEVTTAVTSPDVSSAPPGNSKMIQEAPAKTSAKTYANVASPTYKPPKTMGGNGFISGNLYNKRMQVGNSVNSVTSAPSTHSAASSTTNTKPEEDELISSSESSDNEENPEWKVVGERKKMVITAEDLCKETDQNFSKVHITPHYSLNAIKVKSWDRLKNMKEGVLYYVESADHFAMNLSGMFIHGNIGKIYTNEKDPLKIKNCRFGDKCTKQECNYYHNPLTTPNCNDRRNFIASSFLYSPPVNPYKNKRKARRYGDRDNIEIDITELSEDEGERYLDQTMHDILCCLLLYKYRRFTQ